MTGAQIIFLCRVEHRPRVSSFLRCRRPVLQSRHRVLKIGCRPANVKVMSSQIGLLSLVKLRAELGRITLHAVAKVRLGQVVPLHIEKALRTHAADIEVVRLDRMDEVFVWRDDCRFRVLVPENALVRRNKPELVPLTEQHTCLLRLNVADRLFLRVPASGLPCDSVVRCRILLVFRKTSSDVEVGRIVLGSAVDLTLAAPVPTLIGHLLEPRL